MKKLKSFKSTRVSIRVIGIRSWLERLPVFDDGENESLEDDVHSFVDKTSHLRRCVEMNILLQPYLHPQHSDLLSYVKVS